MMPQHTLNQLHQLRLDGMARALEEQWTLPASHSLSFDERLGLLLDREPVSYTHLDVYKRQVQYQVDIRGGERRCAAGKCQAERQAGCAQALPDEGTIRQ